MEDIKQTDAIDVESPASEKKAEDKITCKYVLYKHESGVITTDKDSIVPEEGATTPSEFDFYTDLVKIGEGAKQTLDNAKIYNMIIEVCQDMNPKMINQYIMELINNKNSAKSSVEDLKVQEAPKA